MARWNSTIIKLLGEKNFLMVVFIKSKILRYAVDKNRINVFYNVLQFKHIFETVIAWESEIIKVSDDIFKANHFNLTSCV